MKVVTLENKKERLEITALVQDVIENEDIKQKLQIKLGKNKDGFNIRLYDKESMPVIRCSGERKKQIQKELIKGRSSECVAEILETSMICVKRNLDTNEIIEEFTEEI